MVWTITTRRTVHLVKLARPRPLACSSSFCSASSASSGGATLEALKRLRDGSRSAVSEVSTPASEYPTSESNAMNEDAFNWTPSERITRLFRREFEHGSSSLLHIQRQLIDERLEAEAASKPSDGRPSINLVESFTKAEAAFQKYPCKEESALRAVAGDIGAIELQIKEGDEGPKENTLGETLAGALRDIEEGGMVNESGGGHQIGGVPASALDLSVRDDDHVGSAMMPSAQDIASMPHSERRASKLDDAVSKLPQQRITQVNAPETLRSFQLPEYERARPQQDPKPQCIIHAQCTNNNTILTLTDMKGNVPGGYREARWGSRAESERHRSRPRRWPRI